MNSKRKAHLSRLWGLAPLILAIGSPAALHAATPAPAAQHGFNVNTYSANFTPQTIDMNGTLNRGYKWYLTDLFSKIANSTSIRLNSDGSVTFLGDNNAPGELCSMAPYRGTNTFVGTAFGGGLYVEAVLNFDLAAVIAKHPVGTRYPYPSFWALAMEGNVIKGADQWPGQPAGYTHSVEVDFFEADYGKLAFGSGLHDWYGIPKVTCPTGACVVGFTNPSGERDPPAGTNFSQYHTYGFLWVPATATTQGSYSAYFDGELIGNTRTWTQYTNQPPTPVGQPWAFGRIDQQHLFFILGTGVGETMSVKSVNVWQKDSSKNMSN